MLTNVFAGLTFATAISGLCLYLVGAFRLGRLLRFVPSAVTGGFLGATGVVVFLAAFKLAAGYNVLSLASHLSESQVIIKLAAALGFFLAYQLAKPYIAGP